MKFLNKFIFPHWFIRFKNKKFLMVELLFLYFLIAALFAAYRTFYEGMNDINSFQFVDILYFGPFVVGIAFMIYKYYAPKAKVLDLPDSYWKTQLSILSSPNYKLGYLSSLEKDKLRFFKKRWFKEYNEEWDNMRMVKLQAYQPLLLFILPLVIYVLMKWL